MHMDGSLHHHLLRLSLYAEARVLPEEIGVPVSSVPSCRKTHRHLTGIYRGLRWGLCQWCIKEDSTGALGRPTTAPRLSSAANPAVTKNKIKDVRRQAHRPRLRSVLRPRRPPVGHRHLRRQQVQRLRTHGRHQRRYQGLGRQQLAW